jgi:predicted acyltransferase
MKTEPAPAPRIASLDQFRGYTVAGMFLVNFFAGYAAIHPIFQHNVTYCSYADLIMPQFFLAVGFAYRLTFLRNREKDGVWRACRRAVNRNLGLILLGVVFYKLDGSVKSWAELQTLGISGFLSTAFRIEIFQALVHIGLTGLWILPVIGARAWIRIVFLIGSAGLHLLLTWWFYQDWRHGTFTIDGGPLGFMTWAIPMLIGSLAYDVMTSRSAAKSLLPLTLWAALLMLLGYAISFLNAVHHTLAADAPAQGIWRWLVEPPFVPPSRPADIWTMNQLAGSESYQVFGAGFSLAVLAIFILACDAGPVRIGLFRTFGTNALAAYLIHETVLTAIQPWTPHDAPLWFALFGFSLFFGLVYFFVRYLEKKNLFLRL